jgi:uncharacterized membrane protein YhaH (DUF805 family)
LQANASACQHAATMDALALFTSPAGRIARKPFAIGVVVVYLVSFGSRTLLASPAVAQGGLAPFMVAQLLIVWAWYVLHAKRLRDAQRSPASAVAVAVVYGFAIALMALIAVELAPRPGAVDAAGQPSAGWAEILIVLYLLALFSGEPHLGIFGTILVALMVLVLAPIVITLVFSIVTGARRSVEQAP